jgi:hypothetical protein
MGSIWEAPFGPAWRIMREFRDPAPNKQSSAL